ncbi:hypothetical protein BJ165DRAFT_1403172 [Panaeolus papilionaceus]|nr:hypothetical protein BJ165DRAFT_1403172 [Panaeolus papilionaceus]
MATLPLITSLVLLVPLLVRSSELATCPVGALQCCTTVTPPFAPLSLRTPKVDCVPIKPSAAPIIHTRDKECTPGGFLPCLNIEFKSFQRPCLGSVRQQFEELTEEDKAILKELLLRVIELKNLNEALEALKEKSPKLHEMALKILSVLGFLFFGDDDKSFEYMIFSSIPWEPNCGDQVRPQGFKLRV